MDLPSAYRVKMPEGRTAEKPLKTLPLAGTIAVVAPVVLGRSLLSTALAASRRRQRLCQRDDDNDIVDFCSGEGEVTISRSFTADD